MKGKLAILGIVVIVGVYLILSNPLNLFPNGGDIGDIVKQDLTDFAKETEDKLDDAKDNSLSAINDNINKLKKSSTDLLSKQDIVDETVSNNSTGGIFFGKIKNVESTKTSQPNNIGSGGGSGGASSGGSVGSSSGGNNGQTIPTVISVNIPTPATSPTVIQTSTAGENPFDTLSLTIKKQSDNNVVMTYKDTSGKTNSVTITMRNGDRVLFTAQFFASSFETKTLDAIDTPHFIDLVIDHSIHGQITATAFSPAGNTDTSFYGVFKKN